MGVENYSDSSITTSSNLPAGRVARTYPRTRIESGAAQSDLPFGVGCLLENEQALTVDNYMRYGLDVFTGNKGIRYTAVGRGQKFINIVYVVSGNNTALSVARTGAGTSVSPYLVTCTLATDGSAVATTTAALLLAALEAETDVTDILTPTLLGTGATVLTAFSSAPMVNATTSDYPNTFGIVAYGQNASDLANETYLQYDQVGVAKLGFFTVKAYETVEQGDPVRVRLIADGDELVGQFGTTSVSNETALIQGARYLGYSNGIATVFLPDAIKFITD